jgi:hypothetical protein
VSRHLQQTPHHEAAVLEILNDQEKVFLSHFEPLKLSLSAA